MLIIPTVCITGPRRSFEIGESEENEMVSNRDSAPDKFHGYSGHRYFLSIRSRLKRNAENYFRYRNIFNRFLSIDLALKFRKISKNTSVTFIPRMNINIRM